MTLLPLEVTLTDFTSRRFLTRPTLWARLTSALCMMFPHVGADACLPAPGPRYRYSPGMDKPDARFHAVPGAVARKREARARRILRGA